MKTMVLLLTVFALTGCGKTLMDVVAPGSVERCEVVQVASPRVGVHAVLVCRRELPPFRYSATRGL